MTSTETRAAEILTAALRKHWPKSFKAVSEDAVAALREAGVFLVTREELVRLAEDPAATTDTATWARAKLAEQ